MKSHNPAYIRFLNYLEAIERVDVKRLNAIEEQLLDYIALAYVQERELLVGDLIALSQFGSQATLHGRLKNLVAMGYVRLVENKTDGRKKQVIPTSKADKRYEKLSSYLEKAAKDVAKGC